MKGPSAEPWNTRLPAVVSVPPFHGATYSACQASFCLTGSQAIRRPNGKLFGGTAFSVNPTFQPVVAPYLKGPEAFCVKFFSPVKFSGTPCAGQYTSPVSGLYD